MLRNVDDADAAFHRDQPTWGIGDHGRLRLSFPNPGVFDIHAWYDGPPNWGWRNLAMLLFGGILSYLLYRQRKAINSGKNVYHIPLSAIIHNRWMPFSGKHRT